MCASGRSGVDLAPGDSLWLRTGGETMRLNRSWNQPHVPYSRSFVADEDGQDAWIVFDRDPDAGAEVQGHSASDNRVLVPGTFKVWGKPTKITRYKGVGWDVIGEYDGERLWRIKGSCVGSKEASGTWLGAGAIAIDDERAPCQAELSVGVRRHGSVSSRFAGGSLHATRWESFYVTVVGD